MLSIAMATAMLTESDPTGGSIALRLYRLAAV
jgi:hypothetical protein